MIPRLTKRLQWVLPNYCLLCKNVTGSSIALCEPCIALLPWRTAEGCRQCAISLTTPAICGACQVNPPAFDRVIAVFSYQPPLGQFIHRLKFGQKLIYAQILGKLLASYIQSTKHSLPQALIPIPLHPNRLKNRGFNQAGEIAKVTARALGVDCLNFNIFRCKDTAAQARLKSNARNKNIRNAFLLKKSIPYRKIALIDDVVTTTATVREASLMLRKTGLPEIEVWCAARAL